MNELNNIKICVVGGGTWGVNHIRTLSELGRLGAIVEADAGRREELAARFPVAETYPNLESVPFDAMDGFTIATPAETHFQLGTKILRARKPVLIEKPITLTSAEAAKLRDLALKNDTQLMTGHLMLFHPAIVRMKELIGEGRIGKVQYLYSNRLNLGTIRTHENILWSFAPHDISIFQHFIGTKPQEVLSRGGAFVQPGIHDTTMTVLRYPDNVVGHIFVSWLHPFKEHRLVVIGSKGMVSFEDSSEEKQLLFYEKGIDWVRGEPIKRDGPTEVIPFDPTPPLTAELDYFTRRIAEGLPLEIAGADSAVQVLEILERASESLIED